jgi:hypothetical protein
VLQAELANGLSGLLLVTGVDGDSGTSGDAGLLTSLGLRVAASVLNVGLGNLLVRELFNTGISHFCGLNEPRRAFRLTVSDSNWSTVWSLKYKRRKMPHETLKSPPKVQEIRNWGQR